MNLTVTGRHAAVGPEARRYAAAKAGRLDHYLNWVRRVDVILDGAPRHGFTAELVIRLRRENVLVCAGEGLTATAAFDEAYERAARQLSRLKERVKGHVA